VTFIEIMIVITIIGILAVTAIIAMSPAKSMAKMEAAQKELESEITLAKAYALQGKIQNISGTPKTPCGYGIWFPSETQYVIYYNQDTDCETANADNSKKHHSSSSYEVVRKTLSGGIKISNWSGMEVYFTVPNARVHNGSGNELTSGFLSISLTDGTISKTVSVNSLGIVIAEE